MTRPCKPSSVRGPHMHPVALAAALLLASPYAGALPTGAQVQSGTGSVQNLSATQQLVTQGTNKLVIDWQSFSIAEGERVRFSQPSSSAVVLNRVVGYDPSAILGQMEANGRVFLLNPHGVLFGRNARVDATALVVSTLNLSNADFLAGQYRLNSDDGLTARGTVVNEGIIAAGTVALVGPQVVNRGLIQAPGGRVGLAAADRVLVDVEGDGLVLFQTEATQAGNRLDQLGRIEANGGSVELRAAARGSFADMVLNMEGVVQARSLGLRDGRVVIDGGASGITRVAGSVDVSGTASGERGGSVAVLGDRVVLDTSAVLDARGDAGGGSLLVGGNWQGSGEERHASATLVAADASLDASALSRGDGGKVVVWSDGVTQFDGSVRARGGALGGDGGQVETSGSRLLVQGAVDAGATSGGNGLWLLDPTNITIGTAGNADVNSNSLGTSLSNGADIVVTTGNSTSAGNDNGDILLTGNVTANLTAGQSATLTLSAARNITIDNNNFIAAGSGSLNVNLFAAVGPGNVAGAAAAGTVTMSNAGSRITANGGDVHIIAKSGVTLEQVVGARVLDVASGGSIAVNQNITTTGNQVWSGAVAIANAIALDAGSGKINLAGGLGASADNLTLTSTSTADDAVRIGGAVTGVAALNVNGKSTLAANVTTTGTQTYTGTTTLGAGTVTLNADAANISLAGVAGGGNNLVLTTTSVAADAVSSGAMSGLGSLTVNAASTLSGSVASSGDQTYAGLVTFSGSSLDAGAGKIDLQSGLTSAGAVTLASSSTSADAVKTGANITSVGLTVSAPLTLSSNAVLDAGSGKASFAGAIAGGTHALEIRSTDASADAVSLQGAVSGVSTFTITGKSTLAADITSSGAQTYTDAVTLGSDVVFTGVGIDFQSTLQGSHAATVLAGTGTASFALDVGGGGKALTDLTVGADAISFGGSVTGTGTATLYGGAEGSAIDLVGAGTVPAPLLLAQTTLDKFAAASGFTRLVIGSGVAGGDITAADLLLTNATTLRGANITLAKVDSAALPATTQALAIEAGTAVTFSDVVGATRELASLDVTGTAGFKAGLKADITTSGAQTFEGAVDLLADVTLTGSSVNLLGGANGAQGLTISGDAVLAGGVGNLTALTALSVSGATELRAVTVATDGDQNYGAAVTLAQGASFLQANGHNIDFAGTLGSADATGRSLTVTATGDGATTGIVTFTGAIGATHALADLTLSADAMVFTAPGTIGGTGTATLATGTLDKAIGLAGAAGDLQFAQATLDRFAGFDTLVIGRASGAGAITANALVLPTDTTLQSGSGAIVLGLVDSEVPGPARDLVVSSPLGTVSAGGLGDTGVLRSVDITASAITLNDVVFTQLGQRYAGPVSFTFPGTVMLGASLEFTGSVDTAGVGLIWRTDALTLGGNVVGGGSLQIAPVDFNGSLGIGTSAGSHALDIGTGTLARLSGVDTLTLGVGGNGGIDAATALVLPTDTVLRGGSGTVALAGTVDGRTADAQWLTVDVSSGGSVSFGGDVGATTRLAGLTVSGGGSTALAGLVRTAGSQNYGGDVSLTGTTTLEADALAFSAGATLDVGTFDLVLAYDSTFTGLTSAIGSGVVSFAPRTASRNIFVGNDDGGGLYEGGVAPTGADFVLTNANLAAFSGFARLGVGRPDGSGNMLVGVLAPPAGTTSFKVQTGTGDLRITRDIVGSYDFAAQSASGNVVIGRAGSGFSIDTGSADQAYTGKLVLYSGGVAGTSTFRGNDIAFGGTVNASAAGVFAESANVFATGTLSFAGAVGGVLPLGHLYVGGNGTTELGGNIGVRSYVEIDNPLRLTGNAVIKVLDPGLHAFLWNTVDSKAGENHALTIDSQGDVYVRRSVGAADALSSFTVTSSGNGVTYLMSAGAGQVNTTGDQSYGRPVQLNSNTVVKAANVAFLGTVDAATAGSQSLSIESSGATVFDGDVGASRALAALTSDAPGSISLKNLRTYGDVMLQDTNVTLDGAVATLAGGHFTATGATTLAGASSVSTGSGDITFLGPVDAAADGVQSLSVNSGGTTLFAADLGAFRPLASLSSDAGGSITIGNVTATGAITLGDANVTITGTTTTFASGGDVTVAGSLDGTVPGAQSLVVVSPGVTSFQGNVGSAIQLASLLTDPGGSTSVSNVSTTGPQAYFDTLTLGADALLSASAVQAAALSAGGFNLTLRADAFDIAGTATGTGNLDIAPTTVGGTIGVAGGAGTLQLGSALLAKLTSFNFLKIGRDGSGDITVGGLLLPTHTYFAGGSGDVNFIATVDGAKNLSVGTSGATRFIGPVGGTTPLATLYTFGGGTTTLGSVTTSGYQYYADDVVLAGDAVLSASSLSFINALYAGAHALTTRSDFLNLYGTVDATGNVSIAPSTAAGSMGLAGASGTLMLDSGLLAKFSSANMLTLGRGGSGAINAGSLVLPTDTVINAGSGNVTFSGSVDGAHMLAVASSGATVFAAPVGAAVPLTGLFTDAGGSASLASVTTTGPINLGDATVTLNGNVATGNASFSIAGDTLLGNSVTVDAGSGDVTFTGTVKSQLFSPSQLTVLSSGATTFVSDIGGANPGEGAFLAFLTTDAGGSVSLKSVLSSGGVSIGDVATFNGTIYTAGPVTFGAASTLSGTIQTENNGTVTASGPVTIAGAGLTVNTTVNGGVAQIVFGSTVDGTTAGAQSLTTLSVLGTSFGDVVGAIVPLQSLTVSGPALLTGAVTTTGVQTYNGSLVLNGDIEFFAEDVVFGGPVSGSGSITLAPSSLSADVFIADAGGGAGSFTLSQADLDKFEQLGGLIIGRDGSSGTVTVGDVLLSTNITLRSSGNVNFTGSVDSNPNAATPAGIDKILIVDTTGMTSFAGPVGAQYALESLAVHGPATIAGGSITTTVSQNYAGNVSLTADTRFTSPQLDFGAALAAGVNDLQLVTDALSIAGIASGTGLTQISPLGVGSAICIACDPATTGALLVPQALIDSFAGAALLTIGSSTGTGAVTANAFTLPTDIAIVGDTATVSFTGTVASAGGAAHALSVSTTGTTLLQQAVGAGSAPLSSLLISGPATLAGGSITTTGAQSYGSAVTLAADTALTGGSIAFVGTVDGAHALTVNAPTTSFGAALGSLTALASLSTDAAGTTSFAGPVTASGAITLADRALLAGDVTLRGTSLALTGGADGAHALTLQTSGSTQLAGNFGGVTPLGSLAISGALTLAGDLGFTGGSFSVGGDVDGAHAMSLNNSAPATFGGDVGTGTALTSLSVSGALVVNGATTLSASALALGGPLSGAMDLSLLTDQLTGATSLAGSGVLTIAPLTASHGIGLTGGAGALQISQATLDGAGSFSEHRIGRSDGSGTVSAGNLQLRADTTLLAGSAGIDLTGTIDGAFALALNAAGRTRIAGSIGSTGALKSLSIDDAGAADEFTLIDAGTIRIASSGAQVYGDRVQATGDVQFDASTVTALHAGNVFDGALSGNVGTMDLRAESDLALGSLRLASGGSIEANGILSLAGNLVLDGGTLSLTSNAVPVAGALSDAEYADKLLAFRLQLLQENSAVIEQLAGSTVVTAANSLLVLRAPQLGSISLDQVGNVLAGGLSAVSGPLNGDITPRFSSGSTLALGMVRLRSSEINVAGAPPANGDQTLLAAGIEADAIRIAADRLSTGPNGQIRARLPFDNTQGSQTSLPSLTLELTPASYSLTAPFGGPTQPQWLQVKLGDAVGGGFMTLRPLGAAPLAPNTFVFLGGEPVPRPFYDGSEKPTEIAVFYNGEVPRTPQEAGALNAVTSVVENARRARFEEAVRTENVASRLRQGVIAEVGAGRPATEGREGARTPPICSVKPASLQCE